MCQFCVYIVVCWLHKIRTLFSPLFFYQFDISDILSSMNERTQHKAIWVSSLLCDNASELKNLIFKTDMSLSLCHTC